MIYEDLSGFCIVSFTLIVSPPLWLVKICLYILMLFYMISSEGKTGYVPGSMMRRSSTIKMLSTLPSVSQMYCKDMNVFNPPPRR